MGIRLGAVLALALPLLAACGDDGSGGSTGGPSTGSTTPTAQLDGTSWVAIQITEDGAAHELVAGTELWVDFADGNIRLHAGCNTMSGSYAVRAGRLSVGDLAATLMGCAPALMDQDRWLAETVFAAPLEVASTDGRLWLSRDGLVVELRDRARVHPDVPLQGTDWRLDGILTGDTVSSVPAGIRVPTLRIDKDGTVSLTTSCNTGRARAEVGRTHAAAQRPGHHPAGLPRPARQRRGGDPRGGPRRRRVVDHREQPAVDHRRARADLPGGAVSQPSRRRTALASVTVAALILLAWLLRPHGLAPELPRPYPPQAVAAASTLHAQAVLPRRGRAVHPDPGHRAGRHSQRDGAGVASRCRQRAPGAADLRGREDPVRLVAPARPEAGRAQGERAVQRPHLARRLGAGQQAARAPAGRRPDHRARHRQGTARLRRCATG